MRFNPPLHICLGACVLLLGLLLVLSVPGDLARADAVERLPLTDARRLQAADGQRVAVEGRISPRSPVVYRDFVAYVREQYRQRSWAVLERATPPLWVQAGDEQIAVVNDNYTFDRAAATVPEARPSAFEGSVRSRGFLAGSPVLVLGQTVDGAAGRMVTAEYIWPGSRAEYLRSLRDPAGPMLRWGGAASLAGAAWLAVGLVQLRRFLRDPGPPPQAPPRAPRQRGRRAPPAGR